MSIMHDETEGVCLVKVNGALNISQAKDLRQCFEEVSGQGVESVVVDLQDVPLIDSRGLLALTEGYQIFGCQAQNFCLVAPQIQPKLLFDLTGFDRIFLIFDSLAEAMLNKRPEPVRSSIDYPIPRPRLTLQTLAA
jgi:anti-anti-sigma factor